MDDIVVRRAILAGEMKKLRERVARLDKSNKKTIPCTAEHREYIKIRNHLIKQYNKANKKLEKLRGKK